jgi:hypothetical protein
LDQGLPQPHSSINGLPVVLCAMLTITIRLWLKTSVITRHDGGKVESCPKYPCATLQETVRHRDTEGKATAMSLCLTLSCLQGLSRQYMEVQSDLIHHSHRKDREACVMPETPEIPETSVANRIILQIRLKSSQPICYWGLPLCQSSS